MAAKKPTRRGAAAAAKRARYLQSRAMGRSRRRSLVDAGYRPGSNRSVTAMAARLERLTDRQALERALEQHGVTQDLVARTIKSALISRRQEVRHRALQLLARVMGWTRIDASTPDPAPPFTPEELIALKQAAREELDSRRTGDPGPGV